MCFAAALVAAAVGVFGCGGDREPPEKASQAEAILAELAAGVSDLDPADEAALEAAADAAADKLVRLGPEAVGPLVDRLVADDVEMGRFAAHCLGRLGGPEAAEALRRTASDVAADSWVRWGCADALRDLDRTAGTMALIALVECPAADATVRDLVIWDLGRIGDARALPSLRRITQGDDPDARRAAMLAIDDIERQLRYAERYAPQDAAPAPAAP
jgi:HEAT repeat protein